MSNQTPSSNHNLAPEVFFDPNKQQALAQGVGEALVQDCMDDDENGYRLGEYVKDAPNFAEQVADESRTNTLTYLQNMQKSAGVLTQEEGERGTLTEHESLLGLYNFLTDTIHDEQLDDFFKVQATSMLDRLTYIGKKEYDEAAAAIGQSWKEQLAADPELQICVAIGNIDKNAVKSDEYLFDTILKNFDDDELQAVKGRLVVDLEDVTAAPEDVKVILLDDWVLSGAQMRDATTRILRKHPEYKNRIEVQLITSASGYIEEGVPYYPVKEGSHTPAEWYLPVKAYYKAHDAYNVGSVSCAVDGGAHITGSHCAGDYNFNDPIAVQALIKQVPMPPATNIVRPYGIGMPELTQVQRLKVAKQPTPTH